MTTPAAPAAPAAVGKASRDARILAQIDFMKKGAGTDEVHDYVALARAFLRDLATELETSAAQIESGLIRTTTGRAVDKFGARMTARRTVAKLRRAAAHAQAAANDVGLFWRDYQHMYAEMIHPSGRQWEFRSRAHR